MFSDVPEESYFKEIDIMPSENRRKKKDRKLGPMFPKTRKILSNFYAKYNMKLASLLKDKKYLWTS